MLTGGVRTVLSACRTVVINLLQVSSVGRWWGDFRVF